ncbi:MAG: hypothetical protein QOE51_486 [Actinoplanes sp.]|jgi:hypothetical protein|nr:hypothetical protein [Actinoplanes sp.]
MTDSEHGAGVYSPDGARRDRRRKKLVAGISGLAMVLGVGAFYATGSLAHKDQITPDSGALTPFAPEDSPTPTPTQPTGTAAATRTGPAVGPSRSPSPDMSASVDRSTQQRIDAARAASKDGFPVQRALPQRVNAAADGSLTVTNDGSLATGGTMRVITARYDLTGQRELAWAADDGEAVGNAHCTQNFQFSSNVRPAERPTMLLCWRTSADRSVATVAVSKSGRPSKAVSVAEIDKQWRKLQ